MPILTAIVAMTSSRVIGRDGGMPWHLPADLAFFKRTTLGHPVVMGRVTFQSIGRPLPGRRNIVLTRDPDWTAPGVEVIHRPADLDALPDLGPRVFIIGGAEVFQAFLGRVDEIVASHLDGDFPGDTWFPEFEDLFRMEEMVERREGFEVRRWTRKPIS